MMALDSSLTSSSTGEGMMTNGKTHAASGKGSSSSSKSKKKHHGKSSKQSAAASGSSNNTSSSSNSNGASTDGLNTKEEHIYLDNFIKSIEYLPTEVKKDLGTIKELDKKTSRHMNLANELSTDTSKSSDEKNETIRKLLEESVDLSLEKVDIAQRSLNKLGLHIGDLDKKIEELSQLLQQKPQTTLKIESLYIPQLSGDNQVHYLAPPDTSLQSSSSKGNKRLVQHSENLKNLKSGSLKAYPEKELHSHVFNHTPEQEGLVRGNSTTTRSYSSSSTSTSSSSTKKAEKEIPSQITVKTSSGSVVSVPNDRIGNVAERALLTIPTEKLKKQKKTSQPKQDLVPVNCTPLSINATITSASTTRKEKTKSSLPKETTNMASSDLSSLRIPKKDSNPNQTASSSASQSFTTATAPLPTPKSIESTATSEHSKTGKKRKPISSNTGKTKKQKQTIALPPPPPEPIVPEFDPTLYDIDANDKTPYCYCKKTMAEDPTEMVGCDGENCPNNGWVHAHCMLPSENRNVANFYCKDCTKMMKKNKRK